ncbi:MAG TPA: hypothetical protein VGF01_07420 [Terracidiphilus sp.]|jgi:hypothetical protein
MRRVVICISIVIAAGWLLSTAVLAARNLAEYPLRVHIYRFNSYSHYAYRSVDYVDGEGRANLFENGEPRGFDFKYRCGERLRGNPGFETYLAKWKKPGKQLEILLPQFGKPDSYDSCDLDVLMKTNTIYRSSNGLLREEPAASFKEWMEKHQYDPEHGKNEPVATTSDAAPKPPATSSATPVPTH